MRQLIIPLALLVALSEAHGQVTITGVVRTPTGEPWEGELRIQSQMMFCGGVVYPPTTQRIQITGGALNISVQPTDVCGVGHSYRVYYMRYGKTEHVAYWVVPSAPATTTIEAVQTNVVPTPQLMIPLSQLGTPGPAGSVIVSTGTAWVAGSALMDPTSATGDLIYRGPAGTLTRLPLGSAGQVLSSDGSAPQWSDAVGGSNPNYARDFGAATSVSMPHNAGTSDVLVSCYDATGVEIIPDSVTTVDPNTVLVSFAQPTTGRCVVNSSGGGSGGSGAVSSVFGRTGAVTAQAGDYSFSQIAGQLALSQIAPSALQGNGSKIQLFSGTAAANDCAKFDASGNLVSAGAACGTGNGDVSGPAASADGEIALFQGTTGKLLRRASGNGVVKLADGVLGFVSGTGADCVRADGTSGPCLNTIYVGAGLEGSGTAGDPVRLASGGSVASQTFYSASLTFGTVGAQSCVEQNIPAAGATPGETVAAGLPPTLPAGLVASMYSGGDVVVVRLCNVTGAAVDVPADVSFSVRIIRGF